MTRRRIPEKLQDWIDARKRHRLSHAHVRMARELGLNPRKLGKIDNASREPWKMPLPDFIAHLYHERFGRERPAAVRTVEETARHLDEKKAARRAEKRAAKGGAA